jgi:hypothetical protein
MSILALLLFFPFFFIRQASWNLSIDPCNASWWGCHMSAAWPCWLTHPRRIVPCLWCKSSYTPPLPLSSQTEEQLHRSDHWPWPCHMEATRKATLPLPQPIQWSISTSNYLTAPSLLARPCSKPLVRHDPSTDWLFTPKSFYTSIREQPLLWREAFLPASSPSHNHHFLEIVNCVGTGCNAIVHKTLITSDRTKFSRRTIKKMG